jgi:hypothetical protein
MDKISLNLRDSPKVYRWEMTIYDVIKPDSYAEN